jgi:carbon starvation protein CstA
MLFVTIACGAISGWHSLVSTVGTGRQLEHETDALPVGAGSMFSEMLLALLALLAAWGRARAAAFRLVCRFIGLRRTRRMARL